jgi:hypothetical protein
MTFSNEERQCMKSTKKSGQIRRLIENNNFSDRERILCILFMVS